ncbi:MAG: Nramp family divalent metal transporter [Gammaproteobacteria bacterium]|nr:Nramp family divalent metal transporter [Gammaproteobacteria bacterium]
MSGFNILKKTGPGIIVAATGLGAGDIVAASAAGAQAGTVLLWAVVFGGLLKYGLTEGIGRWQLATGTTLLEGWIEKLPKFFSWYFMVYMFLWTFMVAAAMMAACGLAAYAFFPALSVTQWGIIHALLALVIVWFGAYKALETAMKFFIGLMFLTVLYCAIRVMPDLRIIASGMFIPRVPEFGMAYVLSVIGGVGGSITIMSYGYWMREAGWKGKEMMSTMRWDLGIAYGLTALFGVAIIIVSAGVQPEVVSGNNMALAVADQLVPVMGETGKWVFLFGFWGAVFSSMIGVWHGVPFLFANFFIHYRKHTHLIETRGSISKSWAYRGYLVYLAILPMTLLRLERPVWIVIIYTITGAFFMPLLAALLLYMNNSRLWLESAANTWVSKSLLIACMLVFGYLLVVQVQAQF